MTRVFTMCLSEKQLLCSRWFALSIGFIVLFADIFSKYLTHLLLPVKNLASSHYPYGGLGIFKNFLGIEFSLVHATNRGAAWGVLADYQTYLLAARICLVAALILYFCFSPRHPAWRIPLMLIIAGALGNVLDYFLYGHVVDMFHFIFWGYDYPVFNVADTAIFAGISWLFILSFFEKK